MTQAIINVWALTISFPARTILLSESDYNTDKIYLTVCDNESKPFNLLNYNSSLTIEQNLYNINTNDFEDLDEELWNSESTPIIIPDYTHIASVHNT
jgi:hypothetical protein